MICCDQSQKKQREMRSRKLIGDISFVCFRPELDDRVQCLMAGKLQRVYEINDQTENWDQQKKSEDVDLDDENISASRH